jgi:hypothetical protein
LYHVCWDDGDEEDYSEGEYQKAVLRFHDDYDESVRREKEGGDEEAERRKAFPVSKNEREEIPDIDKGYEQVQNHSSYRSCQSERTDTKCLENRGVFDVFHYGFLKDSTNTEETSSTSFTR